MNIDVEVGGGGAIGGFIMGSLSFATVSLTLAANVCVTTGVAVMVVVCTVLGPFDEEADKVDEDVDPLPADIIMALV